MSKTKNILFLFILTTAFCLSSQAKILSEAEYDFPIKNGSVATLASAIIHTPKMDAKVSKLVSKYLRALPYFKGKKDYNIRFYQSKFIDAPLVVLLAGLGGSGKGPTADFLSYLLNDEGYNVLVLPNTITSQFAASLSRTGYVGKTDMDASDLYKIIFFLKNHYQKNYNISSRIHLMGYSHGALMAAHLAEMDSWQRRINFEKVLLLNPPVNLVGGMQKLDTDYFEGREKLSNLKRLKSLIVAGKGILKFKGKSNTYENFRKFDKDINLKDDEAKYLISKSLKGSFKNVVLATQDIADLNIIPKREITSKGKVKQKKRKEKAKKVSYVDYASKALVSYLNIFKEGFKKHTIETVNNDSSLYVLEPYLRQAHNVFLMHNQDDFLLDFGDDKYLNDIFRDRALIFPDGGHLGNIWHPQNTSQILDWLN